MKLFLLTSLSYNVQALESPFLLNHPSPLSNTSAVFGNPAGYALGSGPLTTLGLTMEENRSFENFRLAFQDESFGMGYRYSKEDYHSQFVLGHSMQASRSFALGTRVRYDWIEGQNGFTADWGAQWEMTRYLKLGYYTEDLWSSFDSKKSRPHQFASIGLRPLSLILDSPPYLTVSYDVDFTGFDNQFWENRRQSIFSDFEIMGWLHIQGKMDLHDDKNYSLGTFIQTNPHSLLGYFQYNPDNEKFQSEFTQQIHLKTKKKFVSFPGKLVELDLNKTIVDGRVYQQWFQTPGHTGHLDVIDQIDQISVLKGVRVVLVKTGQTRCGYALASHIRRALGKLKSRGIRLVAYMEFTSNLNYYLASVADQIVMPPSTYFEVKGFGTEITFYRGLLEKMGLEAQFIRHGTYKSYPEVFTRDSMSVEWHENMTSTFNSLWSVFLDEISTSRNLSRDSLAAFLGRPTISLADAVDKGIIDTLLYEDQLMEYSLGRKSRAIKPVYKGRYKTSWSADPTIAVIPIEGMIVTGSSTPAGLFSTSNSGSKTIVKQIRKAAKDPNIDAVILRINSPGGSAVASDIIYRELEQFRKENKPLIVSIGNTCASGGYYIASGGDVLVAEKNSILGSIGIFGGKFVVKGLYDKVHLKKQTVKLSPHADAKSVYRKWDEDEVAAIQDYMDNFYARFMRVVEKGRRIPKDSLAALGEGRIFTGQESLNNGLIDRVGGFDIALSIAKFKLGLQESNDVNIVSMRKPTGEWLPMNLLTRSDATAPVQNDIKNFQALSRDSRVWALSPGAWVFQ